MSHNPSYKISILENIKDIEEEIENWSSEQEILIKEEYNLKNISPLSEKRGDLNSKLSGRIK